MLPCSRQIDAMRQITSWRRASPPKRVDEESAVRTSIVARWAGSLIGGRSSRLSTGDWPSLSARRS